MKIYLCIFIGLLSNWTCLAQDYSREDHATLDSLTAKASSDVHDTSKAKAFNLIGLFHYNKGEANQAITAWLAQLKIEEELGNKKRAGAILNNLGNLLEEHGQAKRALSYYHRSLEIAKELGDKKDIAGYLHGIADVYSRQGKIKKALDHYQRSLKAREELGDKLGVAASLRSLGIMFESQGEVIKSLEYFYRSLKIFTELGHKKGIAGGLNAIGASYYYQGELKKAIDYFHRGLKIREELGLKLLVSSSLTNIGSVYQHMGDRKKALDYFHRSFKIAEELQDKQSMALILRNIGITYQNLGETKKTLDYYKRSLKLSQEIGYPLNIRNAAINLYDMYKQLGNYKKALIMYELYIQMRDSIHNESTQKAAIKQSMQYEYEKQSLADSLETAKELALKDIEIDKQIAQAKAERTTKYGLYCGLSLVLIIAFVLYRSVQLKKKANDEITIQKLEVEHKNKEILDSITYAERIQSAILPPMSLMNQKLDDGFVLYKPKDIVAGDFYWLEGAPLRNSPEENFRSEPACGEADIIYFSAADCTGHGVPGAMMSVMCSNALTKSVKELRLTKPGEILDATTKIIEGRFERSEQMVLDGMDLALCKLNPKTLALEYAGANNPLWIIRQGVLLETKADKQPIGQYDHRLPYANHKIQLQKNDTIYIFSDGFVDQFGGPKGKKFKAKPFKKLLLSLQDESMARQKELIDDAFENWRGEIEQIDDVCIIGVKI